MGDVCREPRVGLAWWDTIFSACLWRWRDDNLVLGLRVELHQYLGLIEQAALGAELFVAGTKEAMTPQCDLCVFRML